MRMAAGLLYEGKVYPGSRWTTTVEYVGDRLHANTNGNRVSIRVVSVDIGI